MSASPPSILMILTWFGAWPGWMRFFLESCRRNPTLDWAIWTDQSAPQDLPPNVRVSTLSFDAYRAYAAERLGLTPRWRDPYKLCDLKPALGWIHRDASAPYDYWGFGDLDVIYGDIRAIYDNYADLNTEILAASIRTVGHVRDAALVGADVSTVPPAILKSLVKHPLTDSGLAQFVADWVKTGQRIV